jgi:hypothetical protein
MPKQKRSYKFSKTESIFFMLIVLAALGGGFGVYWFLLRKKVCSGHGKKQDGKCVCDAGWTGDDCSVAVKQ